MSSKSNLTKVFENILNQKLTKMSQNNGDLAKHPMF